LDVGYTTLSGSLGSVYVDLVEPASCTGWFGCGSQTVVYDDSSPCNYYFDPSSVYNAVNVVELNG